MDRNRKILCIVYGLSALCALAGTWSQNLAFMAQPQSGGFLGFIRGGFANPAAASLSIDLIFLAVASFIFMAVEARRLGVRHLWLYFLLAVFIAGSVAVPLFLIARERRLAQLRKTD
jgi:hypothetical protein